MNILTELEQGNVSAVVSKIVSVIKGEVSSLESQFPILGQFLSQFESDFGQKILADAEALAPAILAGTSTIGAAASQLISQAGPLAASVAANDATNIALNALRMYVSAPSQTVS